jgi:hypothetical protein
MRHLLTLAAAASLLAACHNRSEDEVGAAPDRGDTTAVATDTTKVAPTDSTIGQLPADTTAQPAPDAGMSADTTAAPTAPTADTTSAAPAAPADTTAAAPADTTGAAPSDSTYKQ